jgi:hypothetical protein
MKTTTRNILRIITGVFFLGSVAMGILVHPLWMLPALVFLPLTWNFRYGPELALEGWTLENAGLEVVEGTGITGKECHLEEREELCKAA